MNTTAAHKDMRKTYLRALIFAAASTDSLLDRLAKAAGWNPKDEYEKHVIPMQRERKETNLCGCGINQKDLGYATGAYCKPCVTKLRNRQKEQRITTTAEGSPT